jgi:DNA-binding transcriptional LysR family regulator
LHAREPVTAAQPSQGKVGGSFQGGAGRLGCAARLASSATAGAELIPPALARVRAALPGLEISLAHNQRDEALSSLRDGTMGC